MYVTVCVCVGTHLCVPVCIPLCSLCVTLSVRVVYSHSLRACRVLFRSRVAISSQLIKNYYFLSLIEGIKEGKQHHTSSSSVVGEEASKTKVQSTELSAPVTASDHEEPTTKPSPHHESKSVIELAAKPAVTQTTSPPLWNKRKRLLLLLPPHCPCVISSSRTLSVCVL